MNANEPVFGNDYLVRDLLAALNNRDHALKSAPALLRRTLETGAWQDFHTPLKEHVTHVRFVDFVTAEPFAGLGVTVDLVRRVVSDDPVTLDLLDQALQNANGGDRRSEDFSVDNINTERPAGTSKAQALRTSSTTTVRPAVISIIVVIHTNAAGGRLGRSPNRALLPHRDPSHAEHHARLPAVSCQRTARHLRHVCHTYARGLRQMRVTGAINQKGGVGKTSLVAGVAGALAERGRRVLAGDLDPQGHLTVSALRLARVPSDKPSLAAALAGDYDGPAAPLVVRHSTTPAGGRIDVLPTALRMWTAVRDLDKRADRERQLGRLLAELASDYDHCLLDAPPALDILTDNVLACVNGVLIPVQPEDMSVEALRLLLGQIKALERALRRPPIDLHGLVASLYRRPLSLIDATVMDSLAGIDGLPMLAHLPLAVVVKEAQRAGVPVPLHSPDTETAAAYRVLADVVDQAAGVSR